MARQPTFTDIFIRRPVLSVVVSLLVLLLGVQALSSLSVREFPTVESTQITVVTTYPGASPDVVRAFITTPIQRAVASAEGLDFISSTSTLGTSTITLQVRLDANPDRAFNDAQSKVNEVRQELPREAFDPVVSRVSAEGTALMYIDFSSDDLNRSQITDYLARIGQPAVQAVPGVGSANILGAQTFAMRVWLDPDRMAALNVTAVDVRNALESNNFTAAPGSLKSGFNSALIDARTDLTSVDEFRQLVVANRNGTLVRLDDVADVLLGPERNDFAAFASGLKTVFIEVQAAPGANALDVAPAVHAAVARLQAEAPPGLVMSISFDASNYIQVSIYEVIKTVIEASIIVIIVVYLFLGNVRSTLIPLVTIPLSLIGVLFLMQLMGYSLNLLTLLALVLSIGMVVDDAIVVVENVSRHIEEGMTPREAALQGAREIALPVIGMTITLAAVFAPIGFVTGLTGILFQEFAFTLAAAVVISGVIALTLSPMMCARTLRPHDDSRFTAWLDLRFAELQRGYIKALRSALAARRYLLAFGALVLIGCALFYTQTPQELAPEEDQGLMYMLLQAPESTNIDYLNTYAEGMHPVLETFPEYDRSFLITGVAGATGFGGVILKPWDERDRGPREILEEMQFKIGELSGINTLIFSMPSLPTPGGGTPVQFVIKTLDNYQNLARVMDELQQAADVSGLFIFTQNSLKFDKPQVTINIDRSKANQLGVSMADVSTTLSTLLGGNYVNLFDMDGRSYKVIPQVPRSFRSTEDAIGGYYVRTADNSLVPLSTFVTLERSVQPNSLTSFQQLNSATLNGVPFPGRSMGEALAFLEDKAAEILPDGYTIDFAGESRQFKTEGTSLLATFGFAIIVIFLVLAAQYESFRDPLIILVSVPMSAFGALLVLNIGGLFMLPGFSINIYTQIGLLTLAGLIAKHGILMVSFANELQVSRGLAKDDAIVEAAAIRLRPILMTTAAMVFGVLPLLFAAGAGAVSRFSIGLTIASGMTIGTLFTLFMLPVVYRYLARDHRADLDEPGSKTFAGPATVQAAE